MKKFLTIAAALLLMPSSANSQLTSRLQYKTQLAYPQAAAAKYHLVQTTNLLRQQSGSKDETIGRQISIYLSIKQNKVSSDGFVQLQVNIDSTGYEYTSDSQHYKWSSNGDEDWPPTSDFVSTVMPLSGLQYYVTLTPYYELANPEGSVLTEARNMVNRVKTSPDFAAWTKALTDYNLTALADMNKGTIRPGRYATDSTWTTNFGITLNGLAYAADSAKTTFYLYDGQNFNIKTTAFGLKPIVDSSGHNPFSSSVLLGSRNTPLTPLADSLTFGSGQWDVNISPRGQLNTATGTFDITNTYRTPNEQFTDKMNIKLEYKRIE